MSKLFSISSEIVYSPVIFLFSKKVSMSFKNNAKRKVDIFFPLFDSICTIKVF